MQTIQQNLNLDASALMGNPNNFRSKTKALVLSGIYFRGGSVIFTGTDILEEIAVKDGTGTEIKSFWFSQSYARPSNLATAKVMNGSGFEGTLYLDELMVIGNSITEKYSFQYGQKYCFGSHLAGKDAWGYVNDYTHDRTATFASNMPISVPHERVTQQVVKQTYPCIQVDNVTFDFGNSSNTEVPSSRALVGLLSRLVLPTSGYVDFQYEPNKYNIRTNGLIVKQGGGARIKSMTYFDGQSPTAIHQKYYRYGDLEDGIGIIANAPNRRFDWGSNEYKAYSYSTTNTRISMGGTRNIRSTIYEPASSQRYTYPNGASVYYTTVTEYNSDFGVSTGKRVYNYYSPTEFARPDTDSKIDGTPLDVVHTDGLMGQEHFVKDYRYENGRYTLVHSKESRYKKYSLPNQVKVVYAFNVSTQTGGYPNLQDCGPDYNTGCNFRRQEQEYLTNTCWAYQSGEYGLEVGNVLLTDVIETTVRNDNALTQTTTYYYDNLDYLQPSRIETINSEGHQLTKTLKYCYDFSGDLYGSMKTKNMVSLPVEELMYNNTLGKELSRVKTNYGLITFSPTQSFIAPVSVQKSFGGAALQTVLTYDRYDEAGNILQITGKDKIPVTYVWGYNKLFPIAEVKGATYTQVSGLSSTTSFSTLQSTYDAVQIETGMSERRALLPAALVNSFTHYPLIGLRSMTNAAGLPTYFQYESGRLQMVKDKNQDIVKAYQYNMLNSTTTLGGYPSYLANVPRMESLYTLCYQNVPQTKFPFNYFVEGGKYTGYVHPYDPNFNSSPESNAAQEVQGITGSYVPPDLDCSKVGVKISLYNRGIGQAHLDLFKDGSVAYSRSFLDTSFSDPQDSYTPVDFYVLPGEYQVNVRLEGGNYTGLIQLAHNDPGGGAGNHALVDLGSTITISAGGTYNFVIYRSGQ